MPQPDLLSEDLQPFAQAIRSLPGRPSLATGYRFLLRGGRAGIKLESVLVGGRRFTSTQALARFVHRNTAAADAHQPAVTPGGSPQSASELSNKLDAEGL